MFAQRFTCRALVALCLVALMACSGGPDVAGTYKGGPGGDTVELSLDAGGKGHWTAEDEEIPFNWELRGGKLWLHTKTGGLVTGELGGDGAIDMVIPGLGPYHFERQPR